MGAILVFAAAIASLSAGLAGNTDPAFIGLCIAYALMVSYRGRGGGWRVRGAGI